MPLSEQEQRLLEEMERSLYHNDADYVAGSSGAHGKPTYGRIATGILVGVVGIAALIGGVATHLPIVGVVGFVLMFFGVLVALTPARPGLAPRSTQAPDTDATFSQDSGDRWDGRPDEREE